MSSRKPTAFFLLSILLFFASCSTRPLPKEQDILGWEKETLNIAFPNELTALNLQLTIYEPSFQESLSHLVVYLHFPDQPMRPAIQILEQHLQEDPSVGDTIYLFIEAQGEFSLPLITENREFQPYLDLIKFIQDLEKDYQLATEYQRHFIGKELSATEGIKLAVILPGYFKALHLQNPWLKAGSSLQTTYQILSARELFTSWNTSRTTTFLTLEKAFKNLDALNLSWLEEMTLAYVFHHLPHDLPELSWLPIEEQVFYSLPIWNQALLPKSQSSTSALQEFSISLYSSSLNDSNYLGEKAGEILRILRNQQYSLDEKKLPRNGSLLQNYLENKD